jgi:transposase-like protein
MGAEETQEFTHCKDEQDKLLAPMAKEHMLRKEVGFGLWRLVGDLLVKLQNAEEASKDGMAKLQEELNKLKAQLAEKDAVNATRYKIIADLQKAAKDHEKRSSEQANELKMSHKKALADKDTELSKLKAQLAEKDEDNAIQYTIIADLEKAAKDREKRSSEQANELKMSHKKSPADKDTGLSKLKAQLGQAQAQVQQPQMQTTTDAGDFLRYTTVCM